MGCVESRDKDNSDNISKSTSEAVISEMHLDEKIRLGERNDYPMRNIFKFAELTLDSRIESGNLMRAERTAPFTFELWIARDCYKTSNGTEISPSAWFYFKVSELKLSPGTKSQELVFTIKNMSQYQKKQLNSGFYTPVYKTAKTPSWQYCVNAIEDVTKVENSYQWTFRHEVKANEGDTYFAYTFPFSYTNTMKFVDDIEGKCLANPKIYFNRELINYSLEKRRIELLTITSKSLTQLTEVEPTILDLFPETTHGDSEAKIATDSRPLVFKDKKYVLISCRSLPADTSASFTLQGLFKLLTNFEDPQTRAFFDNFVLLVIPMLNPDGMARGHSRFENNGKTLQKSYNVDDMSELPGPNTILKLANSLSEGEKRLCAYFDLNAHSSKDGAFLRSVFNDDVTEDKIAQRKFARLCDIYSKTLDYSKCEFDMLLGLDREQYFSKNKIYIEHKVPLSFSVHVNNCKGTKEKDRYSAAKELSSLNNKVESKPYRMEIVDYENVGSAIIPALLEYYGKHPNSILAQTSFKNTETLNEFVENEVKNVISGVTIPDDEEYL
jgi:hypothetical protein